jgi:hypothetical protein
VEFAETQRNPRTSTAIARFAGEAGALGARNIQAADPRRDAVGRTGRHDSERGANNEARAAFRQAIVDMFGGEAYIPKSVKEAMKLNDYGTAERPSGKPLTARRIMAVKAAIDAYGPRAEQAFDEASDIARNNLLYAAHGQGGVNHEWNGRVDALIAAAVNASVGDPDALDVVKAAIVGILKDAASNLRTEEQVKQRVSNILASVAELKAAAKGNAHIMKAGKELLVLMGGKKIPDGVLRSLVGLTMKQSVGKLKSLSPRTSGTNLHKAVAQTLKNVDKAMFASGAELALKGDTIAQNNMRKFCIAVQLARCGDAEARRIANLFDSDKAAQLADTYGRMINGNFRGLSANMVSHMQRLALVFADGIGNIYSSLQERIGVPEEGRHGFGRPQDVDCGQIDSAEVTTDLYGIAGERADRDLDLFLHGVVVGGGRGADKVRGLFSNVLGERPYHPDTVIKDKVKDNVLGLFNRNFCKARKAGNPLDAFKADLENGSFSVTLPDGVALTAANAPDKLASFVTHGEKTTFQELGDNDKVKVFNLVSMLSRQNADIAEKAEALALDGQGREAKLEFGGDFARRRYSLSFEDNNSFLVVRCETERTLASLRVKNGAGFENVPVGPGSKVKTRYDILIPADEIDRLARIGGPNGNQFRYYDDQDVEARVNNLDGAVNPHAHSRIGNVLGDLKIQGAGLHCTTGFELTLN